MYRTKNHCIVFCFLILLIQHGTAQSEYNKYKTGDIIFQSSGGTHARAIQMATHSRFSHTGIIVIIDNKYYVAEAIEPVSITPLHNFIVRGTNKTYEVMRLKNVDKVCTVENNKKLMDLIKNWTGKSYDTFFDWSDDEMYCSELVYKLYQRCYQISLCSARPLRDFDLANPLVVEQLKIKYGNQIPYESPMIAPQQIYDSSQLTRVH